jgi:hypothetical protein
MIGPKRGENSKERQRFREFPIKSNHDELVASTYGTSLLVAGEADGTELSTAPEDFARFEPARPRVLAYSARRASDGSISVMRRAGT